MSSSRSRRRRAAPGLLLAGLAALVSLHAAPPRAALAQGGEAPVDDALARARAEYVRATELSKDAQWAEALAAFERSAELRPHPATTYNIAACHRALGAYTLARLTLGRALAEDRAAGGVLPREIVAQIDELAREIDRLVARATVTLRPENAAISIDGRPLLRVDEGVDGAVTLAASARPAGPAETPPASRFELLVNPGAHVITVSRRGFRDVVLNRTFPPGARVELPLELSKLPAMLHIRASQPGAEVHVDGVHVGVAPAIVSRPGGTYRISVKKEGFVAYQTVTAVEPGETGQLLATLTPERPALTERWWFWTAASVLVTGVAVGTYAATRPDPVRPPVDGGGLGWAKRIE